MAACEQARNTLTTACSGGKVGAMPTRVDTAEETWEELEARLAQDAAAAEAGAYDHIFDPMYDELFSQMPDGYIMAEGSFFRLDPELPDHFYLTSGVTGRQLKAVAPYPPPPAFR